MKPIQKPNDAQLAYLRRASINGIGAMIYDRWPMPYFGAVPYIRAIREIDSDGFYGCDDWKSIVLYFLSNARTWRGPEAKAIKEELKARVKANAMNGTQAIIERKTHAQ